MSKKTVVCCFCGKPLDDVFDRNNPWPANQDENAVCCSDCNMSVVIPARLQRIYKQPEQ